MARAPVFGMAGGRGERAAQQLSGEFAVRAAAGSGTGKLHAEIEVGCLLLRFGGIVVRGVARGSPLAPAAAVEFVVLAGGVLPASRAFGAAIGGFSVALPVGFARRPVLPPAVAAGSATGFVPVPPAAGNLIAAIHRVRRACRMITGPVAVALAAEHGLPGGLFRRRIERREALAGGAFERVGELPGVVGDEPGRVPRP